MELHLINSTIIHSTLLLYICAGCCVITVISTFLLNNLDTKLDIKEGILKKSRSKFSFSAPASFSLTFHEVKS